MPRKLYFALARVISFFRDAIPRPYNPGGPRGDCPEDGHPLLRHPSVTWNYSGENLSPEKITFPPFFSLLLIKFFEFY